MSGVGSQVCGARSVRCAAGPPEVLEGSVVCGGPCVEWRESPQCK